MAIRARCGAPDGVWADVQPDGGLAWLSWGTTRIGMYAATGLETPLANLWLRRRDGATAVRPLLGPTSGSHVVVTSDGVEVSGQGLGVDYRARLVLAADRWAWHVSVTAHEDVLLDVVAVQDVALAPPWLVRMNELYGAQYLDVTPLEHADAGTVLAVRQNQLFEGTNPWLVMAATDRTVGWATDLLDLAGLSLRTGDVPAALLADRLPSRRLQHEHTLVALQTQAVEVAAGETHALAVGGLVVPDHPEATGTGDLAVAEDLLAWAHGLVAEGSPSDRRDEQPGTPDERRAWDAVPTVFAPLVPFPAREPTPAEVSDAVGDATYVERDGERPLAWFHGPARHTVDRGKELGLVRPHGHLLRTGGGWLPDEAVLTTTVTMGGLFASYLTQGHVSKDRLLSVGRGYLGHQRAAGLRVLVERDGAWQLLDQPTTWTLEPSRVTWRYVTDDLALDVVTTAPTDRHAVTVEVAVVRGEPVRLLFAAALALDGDDGLDPYAPVRTEDGPRTVLRPPTGSALAERRGGGGLVIERTGGAFEATPGDDAALFADGASRGLAWYTLATPPTASAGLVLTAELVEESADPGPADFWDTVLGDLDIEVPDDGAGERVRRLLHVLPWLVNNALTHYLSPRGIEQYTGGGWGTRDVSQGPVELLLALDRHAELRALLLRLFASQSPDGSWGQAFEIFPIDRTAPHGEAHGDVIFWPVLALGRYLLATGDATLLDEVVPYYTGSDDAPTASLADHAGRAIERAGELVVPGTHLTAYGHGDWNDSLQPADPAMKEGMTSSWTVTLHHQALETLAAGLDAAGVEGSAPLRAEARTILAEFQADLVPDGTIAGYGIRSGDGAFRYLLHPRDTETGLTYSILPMIHATIDEMLTPEQADHHARLVAEHLVLPDGAHLFDRPPTYRGGPMVWFQRAESASFFGREIGTMYTHAHLRYAESLARLGRGPELLHALDLANPVDTRAAAAHARRRQATTYFSSSDAVVPDRYVASEQWDAVRRGEIEVEGGWRVYSSGPGIALRIVVECLLGVVRRADALVLDPVLVPGLDGLRVTLPVWGRRVTLVFQVGERGFGPAAVRLAQEDVPATREENRYREGGLRLAREDLEPRLSDGDTLHVLVP